MFVTSERRLVINADDLGMVASVNRGIIESIEHGVVTSTSLMVNMPGFEDAIDRLRDLAARRRDVGVGLHFNVVAGHPLTPCETLLAGSGFAPLPRLVARGVWRRLDAADVRRELDAQLEVARDRLAALGVGLTHIDSHRHAHCIPAIYDVVVDAAARHRIPHVRHPYESGPFVRPRARMVAGALRLVLSRERPFDDVGFCGLDAMASPTFGDDVRAMIARLKPGTTELMVHPGYDSQELAALDSYRSARERELRALTSESLHSHLHTVGVRLTRFGMS